MPSAEPLNLLITMPPITIAPVTMIAPSTTTVPSSTAPRSSRDALTCVIADAIQARTTRISGNNIALTPSLSVGCFVSDRQDGVERWEADEDEEPDREDD